MPRLGAQGPASLSLKTRPSSAALPPQISWGGIKSVEGGSVATLSSSYSVGNMSGATHKKNNSPFLGNNWSKDLRKPEWALPAAQRTIIVGGSLIRKHEPPPAVPTWYERCYGSHRERAGPMSFAPPPGQRHYK